MPNATREWINWWSQSRPVVDARPPARALRPPGDAPADAVETTQGWHDSSFDLRQGLDVVERYHDRPQDRCADLSQDRWPDLLRGPWPDSPRDPKPD